jgi:sodium/potassium-transporting ATPase subunit beta
MSQMEIEDPFFVRSKPDPIPFGKFLYNSENGLILGRTKTSWGKLAALLQ